MRSMGSRSRWTGVLVGLALAGAACAPGVAVRAQEAGQSAGAVLYVANQDDATVARIDARTLEVLGLVDLQALGFTANAKPHHIVVEPDGSHWYVSLIGDGKVAKLDRSDRVVSVFENFETPGMLALDPTNRSLYVGRSMSAVNPPSRIGVVDRSTMEGEQIDVFFPRPHAIVAHPTGGIVYTASLGVNQMAVVDATEENAVLVDVAGSAQHALMQFALSPDGRTLVASGELSGQLLVFDVSDPHGPQQAGSVAVGRQPFDPIFSPDGRFVWVPVKADDRVTVVDAATWTVVSEIEHEGFAQPHGIAFSPDGRYVFVSNNNMVDEHAMHGAAPRPAQAQAPGTGRLVVIDAATREVVKVIPVGRNATGIGIRPRGE